MNSPDNTQPVFGPGYDTSARQEAMPIAYPYLLNGRLYVFVFEYPSHKTNSKLMRRLHVFDPQTGTLLDKLDVDCNYSPSIEPVYWEDSTYLYGQTGGLMALDLATAQIRWKIPPEQPYLPFHGYRPTLSGSLLYTGSSNGIIRVVDRSTGEQLRLIQVESRGFVNPIIASYNQLVYGYAGHDRTANQPESHLLFCLHDSAETSTSKETTRWNIKPDFAISLIEPVVAKDLVLSGAGSWLEFRAAANGMVLCRYKDRIGHTVHDGILYLSRKEPKDASCNSIEALNLDTVGDGKLPELLWQSKSGFFFRTPPVYSDALVISAFCTADMQGEQGIGICALDAHTGELKWQKRLTGRYDDSYPLIADNGVVYFPSGRGNLHALETSTGAQLWHYKTDNYEIPSIHWAGPPRPPGAG